MSAGFSDLETEWYILKHNVFGDRFIDQWKNNDDVIINPDVVGEIGQDDDVEELGIGDLQV
jgi:hypothetical protein